MPRTCCRAYDKSAEPPATRTRVCPADTPQLADDSSSDDDSSDETDSDPDNDQDCSTALNATDEQALDGSIMVLERQTTAMLLQLVAVKSQVASHLARPCPRSLT